MKTIRDRFTELRGAMLASIPDAEIMEMAEQDAEFQRQWLDFQNENPRFKAYKTVLDLDPGKCDPAWLELQKRYPRFLGHRLVKIEDAEREDEEAWLRVEESNFVADLTSGAALGLALSRARTGKKTSLRMLENMHRAMAVSLQIVAAAVAIFAAALVGFHFGRQAVFDQLPAAQQQEIRERTNSFFNTAGD